MTFGAGGIAGDGDTLFFTDGIDGEKDGLFGALTVPEPSTWAMMLWVWRTRTLGCAAARVPSRRLKAERGPEPPEIKRFFSGRRVTVKP